MWGLRAAGDGSASGVTENQNSVRDGLDAEIRAGCENLDDGKWDFDDGDRLNFRLINAIELGGKWDGVGEGKAKRRSGTGW